MDLAELELATGLPADQWHGRCFEIATAAAKLIPDSRAVYGHWLGGIAEGSWWFHRKGQPFIQHGWVKLKGGGIMDPTRFSFEGKDPYLWEGPLNKNEYDEGGNKWRMAMMGTCPEFDAESSKQVYNITTRHLPSKAWGFVEKLLGLDRCFDEEYEPGDVTVEQLHWLANYDPNFFEGHARDIYQMLDKFQLKGLVPYDNWQRVMAP